VTATAEERRLPVEVRRGSSHHIAELMLRFRELGIVLALILVFGGTTIDNHRFASGTSLQQLLAGAAIIALLAIGETIVIVTRNVDLSIGSVVGLSAYAAGSIFVHFPHVPIPVVLLAGTGLGAACGVVNGAIVTILRVPSLVVTLGTLYVIRGIDAAWAGGNQIASFSLPDSFNKIGYGTIAGVPYLGLIAIGSVAIATYAMRSFRTGRDFYAIGSNP
jgi:rhamnose transport system permease protein